MPTVTGTSIVGRQVLASGATAASRAFLKLLNEDAALYRYYGWVEMAFNQSGNFYSNPDQGCPIWFSGVSFPVGAAISGNTFVIQAFWRFAGVDWQLIY